MKRLLFVRRTYGFGGVEIILLDWLKHLDYSRYEVFVSSPADVFSERIQQQGSPAKFIHLSDEEVLRIYGRYRPEEGINDLVKGSFCHFFPIWLRFLWRIGPDIVVFLDGDFFTTPLSSVLAAFLVTRGKVSMTVHSPNKLLAPAPRTTRSHLGLPGLGLWWYQQVWWPLWPWRIRRAFLTALLVASDEVKGKLAQFYGYSPAKIGVLNHGVETARFKPSPEARGAYRKHLGIPDEAFLVVSTSRLSPEKNVDRLIGAFEEVASKNSNIWLALAGDGPLRSAVEQSVAKCSATTRILLLGHVADVVPLLQASDAFVLASTFEARSISLREAMAAGLVCIASRIPGLNEVIIDGQDGFLVDTSQSGVVSGIEKALALPFAERQRIVQRARTKMMEQSELKKETKTAFDALGITCS